MKNLSTLLMKNLKLTTSVLTQNNRLNPRDRREKACLFRKILTTQIQGKQFCVNLFKVPLSTNEVQWRRGFRG